MKSQSDNGGGQSVWPQKPTARELWADRLGWGRGRGSGVPAIGKINQLGPGRSTLCLQNL